MFFDNWADIWRTLVVGTLAYVALVSILRVSGKRTLSKMNAFDLVVTVALGSTLATILLSKDVSLLEGITAFLTLILLQYIVAWLSVRSATVRHFVKSEPSLLLYRGEYLDYKLKTERVTRDEVMAAIRSQGFGKLDEVEAVVLETDGSFSVISKPTSGPTSALKGVSKPVSLPDKDGAKKS
jgi:uncharacterized membrane protein YcaP (DUF421 family)